ncbi:MAG: PG0541 family transporter-associated protein [Spirochaetota bacterium]
MQTEMFRAEIIANQSVQEELAEAIEGTTGSMFYTYIPAVQGKGRQQKRFGDETWPELNCIYVMYVDTTSLDVLRNLTASLKKRFPHEGIKLFAVPALCQEH